MNTVTIYPGDCRTVLAKLAEASVHCVVTSPPYYGVRDYQVAPTTWSDGWSGALGLEPTIEMYVDHIVQVFRAVRRVLRKDGTLWLNMGDGYVSAPPGNKGVFNPETDKDGAYSRRGNRQLGHGEDMEAIYVKSKQSGLKQKDLIGMPWRLALALQKDGWYLRQDIVWQKPNPLPESATDRCTRAHEYLFMLSKASRYYYDAEAIAEPVMPTQVVRITAGNGDTERSLPNYARSKPLHGDGFVNTFVPEPPKQAYASNSPRTDRWGRLLPTIEQANGSQAWEGWTRNKRSVWTIPVQPFPGSHFAVFPPALVRPAILAGCPQRGIVLDPFAGSGTVAAEASLLDRDSILIELSPEYVDMITGRLAQLGVLAPKIEMVRGSVPRLRLAI
jgi:DNA modification methylase